MPFASGGLVAGIVKAAEPGGTSGRLGGLEHRSWFAICSGVVGHVVVGDVARGGAPAQTWRVVSVLELRGGEDSR